MANSIEVHRTLLVVEDERPIQEIYRDLFGSPEWGFETIIVGNAQAAREAYVRYQGKIFAVYIDREFPGGVLGEKLALEFRNRAGDRPNYLHLALLSGSLDRLDPHSMPWIDSFIPKPFRFTPLIAEVTLAYRRSLPPRP